MRQTDGRQAAPLAVFFHPDFKLPQPLSVGDRFTVGSGIGPDLLTFRQVPEALAGSCWLGTYRRWGIPPRPEDVVLVFTGKPAAAV